MRILVTFMLLCGVAMGELAPGNVALYAVDEEPYELFMTGSKSYDGSTGSVSYTVQAYLTGNAGNPVKKDTPEEDITVSAQAKPDSESYFNFPNVVTTVSSNTIFIGDVDEYPFRFDGKVTLNADGTVRAISDIFIGDSNLDGDLLPSPSNNEQTNFYPWGAPSYRFESMLGGTYTEDVPVIYEWTRSAGNTVSGNDISGDVIALTGGNIDSETEFFLMSTESDGGIIRLCRPRLVSNNQFALEILYNAPLESFPRMFYIWPRNGTNYGNPIAINKSELWWVGPDTVSTNETFSVYGRNLDLGGDNKAQLYIDGHGWVTQSASNPYKVDFVCPSLTNGTYDIYIHNGHGGKYGWSDAGTLTVRTPYTWTGTTQTVASATQSAISDAITAASTGDSVFLSNGTYNISSELDFGNKRLWFVGESMTGTVIKTSSFSPSPLGSSDKVYNNFKAGSRFKDLTFGVGDEIPAGTTMDAFRAQEVDDLVFDTVRFIDYRTSNYGNNYAAFNFYDCENLLFTNCTFNTAGQLGCARLIDSKFIDCTFRGKWDANALIKINEGERLVFIDNYIDHYDNSSYTSGEGWIKGRFLNATTDNPWNIYASGNVSSNAGPRYNYDLDNNGLYSGWYASGQPDQNSGEFFMFEGGKTYWRGSGVTVSGTSLTLSGSPSGRPRVPNTVSIVSGKGFGQSRTAVGVSGANITLDAPFNVDPDANSVLMMFSGTRQMIFYNNQLNGRDINTADNYGGSSRSRAVAGFEPYDTGAADWIIDGNNIWKYRTGFHAFSRFYDDQRMNGDCVNAGVYFFLVQNNTFDSCKSGVILTVDDGTENSYEPNLSSVSYQGIVLRQNTFTNLTGSALNIGVGSTASPYTTVNKGVLDNNTLINSTTGYQSDYWVPVGNTADGVTFPQEAQ